jgi:DNA-binding LytR/AlgR family response regulator
MQLHQYVIWLGIEFVALVVLLTAAAWLLNERKEVLLIDLVGRVAIDTVAVLTIPYIVTALIFLLQQKRLEIANLTNMLNDSKAVAEEAKVDTVMQFFDKGNHLVFVTKRSNVLYIEAADNYTVIHYLSGDKEDTLILHNSLKNIADTFSSEGMVRCHRGYLVNLANVKYVRKEKDGLVLEIAYCDRLIPVSKTYAEDVVRKFAQ